MNKNWIMLLVVAVVFGGGGFWGGMTYAKSQSPAARFAAGGGAAAFAGRGGAGGARAGGGATFGTIISTSNGSITVQLPMATTTGAASGTKLVLFNSSTQIGKMVSGSASDLTTGTNVTVAGTANSDGSITATSIQIRPAGTGARGQ